MGLVLRCNDTILLREVNYKAHLQPGHIYYYRTGNQSVIHRYLTCQDDDCKLVIMKGDNNRIPDPAIPRSAIKYEVVGAYYDRN